jgi:hypothetical protein
MRQRLDNCLFFRYIRSESNLARKGTAGRLRPADGSECGFQAEAGRPPGQRNRGGAPGGAARPKQAVRASGLSCGARRARSASEWQHSPAWRGHDFGASRRCTSRLRWGRILDRGFLKSVAWANLGRSDAPRERECYFTSPRRGEVGRAQRGRVRGFGRCSLSRAPEPPHPNPLPCGERERACVTKKSLRALFDN